MPSSSHTTEEYRECFDLLWSLCDSLSVDGYLSVYLPSSSHTTEEYRECFDLLWSLCDSLSVDGYLSVYLPSSSHTTEEYRECFDLLWSLCDSLSVDGYLSVYLPSSSHTTEEYRECFDLLWSLCDSLSVDGYLSVYLPSSSHTTEEYRECFDLLWSLCDSLSVDGYPIVLGDLNGDLGNSLGEKGTKKPNERSRLLLNFSDYFNVCPVNLLSPCEGPLARYNSFCGKYRSTVDYIFLSNCLQDKIIFARTFDFDVYNTSDHQPIIMKLNYHSNGVQLSADPDSVSNLKQKINWSKFNQHFYRLNMSPPSSVCNCLDRSCRSKSHDKLSEFITTIILKSSLSLVTPGTTGIKKRKHVICAKLPVNVKESRSLCTSAF